MGGAGANKAMTGFGGPGGVDDLRERTRRIKLAELSASVEAWDSSPQSEATRKKLETPVAMSFGDGAPLSDVLKYIKSATTMKGDNGIQIYVDPAGLKKLNGSLDSTVSLDLEGIPLRTTLRLALKQLDLAYCVKDGILMISDVEGICRELEEVEAVQNMEGPVTAPTEPARTRKGMR